MHPLDIGGKAAPCRLVFNAAPGPAVAATLIDMGGRMRLLVHEMDAIKAEHADAEAAGGARAVGAAAGFPARRGQAWLLAGGAHHTSWSQAVTAEQLEDLAGMLGVEIVRIGEDTDLGDAEERAPLER